MSAQRASNVRGSPLSNLGHMVHGGHLKVHFDLPYAGVVDFHLAHHTGERFYTNYYGKDKGDNEIKINLASLEVGKTYQYQVEYKGNLQVYDFKVGGDKDGKTYTVMPVE